MDHAVSIPVVSVILPVYNGADCVGRAIDSILCQTFRGFELIVINDGSTKDDTATVLDKLAVVTGDERLSVVHLNPNRGLAGALNHGISIARGRYIARQDQDDISLPDRLASQVRYLEAHPRCGLLGTRAEIWVGDEPSGRHHDHPTDNAALQFDLLTNNPFVHSSVMIRKEALDAVGVYATAPERQPPEDFELWSRIARRFDVANLPERLVIYREMPPSMSRAGRNPFLNKVLLISAENLSHASDAPMSVCGDAAALVHSAFDSVSSLCEIRAVCDLVAAAARRIEARCPGADLRASRDRMIQHLRNRHAAYKGEIVSAVSTGMVRRLLQRMPVIGLIGRRLMPYLRRLAWLSGGR
jgi:glycosyltransferase involved in cell wall biosynthesis